MIEAAVRRARAARAARAARIRPRLSRRAWAADALLALALAVATVVGDLNRSYVDIGEPPPGSSGIPLPPPPPPVRMGEVPGTAQLVPFVQHTLPPVEPWELLAAVLTAAPLLLRRRFPLTAYWAVIGATVLFHQGHVAQDATTVVFAAGLVAAYSAAMHSPHRISAVLSVLAGMVLTAAFPLIPKVDGGVVPVLVLLPAGFAAHGIHRWRERLRTLREGQHDQLRRAVEQERARIARELHDVVTHNVSMMTIQAGAARKVLDASPDQAREAMRAVEAAGRTAMSELRHVMGLLTMSDGGRDGDGGGDDGEGASDPARDVVLAPQPGLDRLEELAGRVRDSGVPVDLAVHGSRPELAPGVDLAAYRVVQEGLTNAVRHAAGARVSVTVEYAPGELRVEVADTGGAPRTPATPGGGRGLVGLRERLAVYGGTLRAGDGPRGGYRLRAVIPVEEM
ncbi:MULTISPECIES: sensor histidine kinase [Streptomyces]|uniref:histidine kinase n=1 Tax=Streptomyces virginiae TaxID=1961 RepID=A0ABZ1T3M1_STRVG|nr:histidine kinase [Streptomyces virginiae]WTB20552.1 histidine kinase [Streptomyces virginiae]